MTNVSSAQEEAQETEVAEIEVAEVEIPQFVDVKTLTTIQPKYYNIFKDNKSGGTIFNNHSNEIDLESVEELMAEKDKYGVHSTKMPWWGHVAYIDGKWVEQIRWQGNIVDELEADSPEELMGKVNAKYGDE
jgi:hypothetical protein